MQKLRQFVEYEEFRTEICKEAFEPRPDKPWWNRWLQAPAFWMLRKLDAYQRLTTSVRRHDVPRGKILQQMQEAVELMHPRIADSHKILIGGRTYQELMHSDEVRSSFAFSEQLGFNRQLYDVELMVVPNVEGWAIVPNRPDVRLH